MQGLKAYIAAINDRFGAIDNMKFLLGSSENLTKEQVDSQLQIVADGLINRTCVPSEEFPEPGLNAVLIPLTEMMQSPR